VKTLLLALAIAAASVSCSSGACGAHADCSSCATDPFCLWCPDSNSCEHLSSGCSNHVLNSSACGAPHPDGGSCPGGTTACGSVCCAAGQSCSNGACGYTTAQLYFYLCPSFNTGNCAASGFSLNSSCVSLGSFTRGTCYATGFNVTAGTTYAEAPCVSCPNNCGSPGSFTTPSVFSKATYYPGTYFYCTTSCTPPTTCP
jgi:hypothetical protein